MKRAFVLHIAVRVGIEAVFFWILHSIAARNNGMDWEIPGVITANSTVSLSNKKSLILKHYQIFRALLSII